MSKRQVLKAGNKVGIVAPGAIFNRENFKIGLKLIESWGLVPVLDKNLFKKDFIYAGTVAERVSGLLHFIKQKDIKAIWCVRGGYGSSAVAERISQIKTPRDPKLLIGLSDITVLHMVFNQKFQWPTIHGPTLDRMGIKAQPEIERDILKKTLFDSDFKLQINSHLKSIGATKEVEGVLVGGNLSLVCASLGTSWEIETKNKILFLEDIAEPAYRIDRMFTHLQNAGKFKNIKALVFGDFTQCVDSDGKERWKKAIMRNFQKSPFPVLWGVKSGHGRLRLPLPLGSKVKVSTKKSPGIVAV